MTRNLVMSLIATTAVDKMDPIKRMAKMAGYLSSWLKAAISGVIVDPIAT